MKLTNKFGYPDAIVRAVANDHYTKGDSEFSATGLLQPPRIRILTERHKDELEEDVDDAIFRLYGQVGHAILERAGSQFNSVIEKRFFGVVDDTKISAQIDSLSLESDGTLMDFKFTSVYGFKPGSEPKREFVGQLNIQAYLVRLHGYTVNRLLICGLLRDWRPAEFKKGNYPNKLGFHDIPMYTDEAVLRFISKRISLHRAAEKELPLCDEEDNWQGRRCESYCPVNKFCEQYQKRRKS